MRIGIALGVFALIMAGLIFGPLGSIFSASEQLEHQAPVVESVNVPIGQGQRLPMAPQPGGNSPDSVRQVNPSGQ